MLNEKKPRRIFHVLDGPYKGSSKESGPFFTTTAIAAFAIAIGSVLIGLALCH